MGFVAYELPFEVMTVQFHELHGGRFFKLHAQMAGDLPQGVVKMGKVVEGHVSYKCAANFVVTRAAMQPPEKHDKLDERGEAGDDPIGIHGRWVRQAHPLRPNDRPPGPNPMRNPLPCALRALASSSCAGTPRARPSRDELVP